ncbi:MAG: hypothetical protein WCY08_14870 [Rhodocyclaceae bacterium]
MTNIPLPIYIAVFFFLGGTIVLDVHRRYQNRLRNLPALEDYLRQHAQQQACCHACSGSELKEWGLTHGTDRQRVVVCARCSTLLYRYRNDDLPDEDADWSESQ